MINMQDIENRFTYHAPSPEQTKKYEKIRIELSYIAAMLTKLCPESRERSLAMTKLEEVMFWANASIARNT